MRVDRSSQRFDFLVRRFDLWNQIHETGLCLKRLTLRVLSSVSIAPFYARDYLSKRETVRAGQP